PLRIAGINHGAGMSYSSLKTATYTVVEPGAAVPKLSVNCPTCLPLTQTVVSQSGMASTPYPASNSAGVSVTTSEVALVVTGSPTRFPPSVSHRCSSRRRRASARAATTSGTHQPVRRERVVHRVDEAGQPAHATRQRPQVGGGVDLVHHVVAADILQARRVGHLRKPRDPRPDHLRPALLEHARRVHVAAHRDVAARLRDDRVSQRR